MEKKRLLHRENKERIINQQSSAITSEIVDKFREKCSDHYTGLYQRFISNTLFSIH